MRPTVPTSRVLLGAMLLTLCGCSDSFTIERPSTGPVLGGNLVAERPSALRDADCQPLYVEISLGYDPTTTPYPGGGQRPISYLAGRAFPRMGDLSAPERFIPELQPWHVEGDVYGNGTVLMMLVRSTNLPTGGPGSPNTKPFSVLRGTLVDNRLVAVEQPPSCGRTIVAEALPAALAPSKDDTPWWRRP